MDLIHSFFDARAHILYYKQLLVAHAHAHTLNLAQEKMRTLHTFIAKNLVSKYNKN